MPTSKIKVTERKNPEFSIEGYKIDITTTNGQEYVIYISDECDFIEFHALEGALSIRPRTHNKIQLEANS